MFAACLNETAVQGTPLPYGKEGLVQLLVCSDRASDRQVGGNGTELFVMSEILQPLERFVECVGKRRG